MTKIKLTKQTPTHTLDWYVKWIASIVLVVGVILTSNNIYPLNLMVHAVGMFGWFVVAIIWNDRASRNAARKKAGLKKGDPRQVDHKDNNPRNNSKKNLRKVAAKTNLKKESKRKKRG